MLQSGYPVITLLEFGERGVREYPVALAGALAWSFVYVWKWYRSGCLRHERGSLWSVFFFAWAFSAVIENIKVFEMHDGTTEYTLWCLGVASSEAVIAVLFLHLLLVPGFLVSCPPRSTINRVMPIVGVVGAVGAVLLEYALVIYLNALWLREAPAAAL